MHWPICFLRRERERESGVTAIGWPPSAIGSVYRRSTTTTVPVTALSALRPYSTVTRVDLGIDCRPHVRWYFSKNHFPRFCSGIQCILITIEVSAQIGMRNACCVWYTTVTTAFKSAGLSRRRVLYNLITRNWWWCWLKDLRMRCHCGQQLVTTTQLPLPRSVINC